MDNERGPDCAGRPWQKLKEYFMNWRFLCADQLPRAQALLTERRTIAYFDELLSD
jgi:hypothetical protein